MKHPLLLALPCYLLDQATKWYTVRNYQLHEEHVVVPNFFSWVYWDNTGSAFGMFKNGNLFFIALSVVTFLGLLIAWWRGAFRDRWNWWGVGLLLGGILGNVTDRLVHGHVVDFLLFDLHIPFANPWPAFNVADSCILLAVACFLIASVLEMREEARKRA